MTPPRTPLATGSTDPDASPSVATAAWPDPDPGSAAHGPLAGLRVLDLTAYAVGPWAACNLAQLGADVVRVDPPYGDPIRAVLPRKHGEPTTYMSCTLGKRSIVLDLKDPVGHAIVRRLAAAADVVLENSRAGTMDRLGLGYADLSPANPGLVYCSSSSYGDAGPMMRMGSTDPQGQAFSGFASTNGPRGGDPEVLRYVALVDLGTSMQLLNAVLVGLTARRATGAGQHLRTSQMEAAIGLQLTRLAEYFASGTPGTPEGSGSRSLAPSGSFRGSDGRWFSLTCPTDETWRALATALELPDELVALTDVEQRLARRDEIERHLAQVVAGRPSTWWVQLCARLGVPSALLRALEDKPQHHEHLRENGYLQQVPHPLGGTLTVAGPVWRFERTPARLGEPVLPGRDTDRVLGALTERPGRADGGRRTPAATPAPDARPLAGLRVVEIAQGTAGPYCGWLLASLGADVVKVEPPGGDWLRGTGGPRVEGSSAAAYQLNRGKRSVEVDLDSPGGHEVLLRLVADADVLLHPFTTQEAERRDLTPQRLRAVNPRLVDCAVTAYGPVGPWADLPATELEVQSTAGPWHYLGVEGDEPLRIGADVAGVLGGCTAFQGILACLAGGEVGQHVDTSELGALMGVSTVMVAALDDPDTWDGFHTNAPSYPPDHGVRTADGRIYYGQPLRSEEAWVEFCRDIGADALLAEPIFATRETRMPNQMLLRRALEPYFEKYPTDELVAKVVASDGIAVPVQDHAALVTHPQVAALDLLADAAGMRALSLPWRSAGSGTPPLTAPAPTPGADTDEVLGAHGFTPDELVRLRAVGAIGTTTGTTPRAQESAS